MYADGNKAVGPANFLHGDYHHNVQFMVEGRWQVLMLYDKSKVTKTLVNFGFIGP